jgi:hypothetical protein
MKNLWCRLFGHRWQRCYRYYGHYLVCDMTCYLACERPHCSALVVDVA